MNAEFVGSDRAGLRYLAYLRHYGLNLSEDNFTCYADHTVTHWALVRRHGHRRHDGRDVWGTPGIVRVLDDVAPVRFPVWRGSHRELRTSRRIRVVFEALAEWAGGDRRTPAPTLRRRA